MSDPMARKATYSAPALEKAFDIIEELGRAPTGLTVSEMGQRLGRSISEIFRIMIVMERRGWLAKDPDTDRFSVTYKMLELAHQATPAQELTRAAPPVMYQLSQASGQSCHLVIATGGRGLVVLRESAPGPTGFALRLGAEVNLLTSCSGAVLIAFAEPDARATILREIGDAKAVRAANLDTLVATVRERGYETRPSARTRGVTDIGFPVFGFDGRVVAALTTPFLEYIDGSQRVDVDGMRELLRDSAHQISCRLGWVSDLGKEEGPPVEPKKTRKRKK